MVYPDISLAVEPPKQQQKNMHSCELRGHELKNATVLQRLFSVLLDYFILTPVISFIVVSLFTDGLRLYKKFPQSVEAQVILFQMALGFIFLLTLTQALFISVARATPGQIFTKLFVHFDSDDLSEASSIQIFFRAWVRQLGFVFSILCLGIPFVAILYHSKQRAIYERMTETSVLTTVNKPVGFIQWGKVERLFVGAFVNTFLMFSTGLLVLGFQHVYQKTLTSNLTFEKLDKSERFCKELDGVKQQNRLNVATALNMVGVLSDRCLDLEADFVLWRNYSNPADRELKASAYLAKYLTAVTVDDEDKYLLEVCKDASSTKACSYAQGFADEEPQAFLARIEKNDADLLNDVLKYEMASVLDRETKADLLENLEKYSTQKLVNKFIIRENLKSLSSSPERRSGRLPANARDLSKKIEMIQRKIDQL